MDCMIVVNEEPGEACGKAAVESPLLPLDPHGDDEAGRERRLTVVGFRAGPWQLRQELRWSGGVQWFRLPEGGPQNA